MATVPEPN